MERRNGRAKMNLNGLEAAAAGFLPVVPRRRALYALAKEMMSLPCNKSHADKTFVYESQTAYNAYFRELKK